jgi:molybdate transport system substrate-binding protein
MVKLALLAILAVVVGGCESASREEPDVVTVFAAASTTNAMDEIKDAFVKASGVQVRTNYAASSTLAQQIANGAAPDVFLSANVDWADYVEEKTMTVKRRDLLGNRLVIIVPSDSGVALADAEGLLSEEVSHLALGDTDSVPAGRYAKQALIAMDLWDRLKGKVVPGKDVRQALTYVETGAAEAGIVYATDAAVSEKVRVAVEIPGELTQPVAYPVMLLEAGTQNASAERFYEFLGSPEAKKVFEKFGFILLP